MSKPRRIKRITRDANSDDLRGLLHFCAETGQIWLDEHRMLLVHAEAQGCMRKELINTLGMDRGRGLLLRMGFASGMHDAEVFSRRDQGASDHEAFMIGTRLHTLEGIVKVTTTRLEADRGAGKYYGEFLWENSWEGQWHRKHHGISSEPVCWSQLGYACGYTTALMGRTILYKEVECVGMGNNTCRIIGKPIEEWEDAANYTRIFNGESILEELIDLQNQVVQLRSAIGKRKSSPPM